MLRVLKNKFNFILTVAFLFIFSLFSLSQAGPVRAASFTLSGKTTDSNGVAVTGTEIDVIDVSSSTIVSSAISDNSGNYSMVVVGGTYNIKATPPSGSGFSPAMAPSRTISGDTTVNFIFAQAGSATLSGHIYGPLGDPLPNQRVILQGPSGSPDMFTNSVGAFSFQLLPGTYQVTLYADNNSLSLNAPQQYQISFTYSLLQNTVLDLTLPAKLVNFHIQNSLGDSIGNVGMSALPTMQVNSGGLALGSGVYNASAGASSVGSGAWRSKPTTDPQGNTSAWLLPTNNGASYNIIATPPSGTPYAVTTVSNVPITNDTTIPITMLPAFSFGGHIFGPLGDPLPNQRVILQGAASSNMYTDTNGAFLFNQLQAGNYQIIINADNNSLSLNAPQQYQVSFPYTLNQNSVLDLTIPAKRVTFHAQDSFSNSINNVGFKAILVGSNPEYLSLGSGINNAQAFSSVGYSRPQPQTDSSGNAVAWLFPTNNNSYTVTANPPAGSPFVSTTLFNVTFLSDTTVNVTLQQPVVFQGHIFGPLGDPLPNQRVILQGADGDHSVYTDSGGNYQLQVQAGNYRIIINADNNSLSLNAPQQYQISANYSLSQNTFLDLTVPAKKITMHAQDIFGNPISDVRISTPNPAGTNNGLVIGSGISNASGFSSIGSNRPQPQTNSLGDSSFWLLPTNNGSAYTFIITPPSGGIYAPFTLSNMFVTSDQTEIVSLQYAHSTPVTVANLETQNQDGTYSDPTTVTLSATAASGFTIANTYYTVDGGSQQTYSIPFTVLGSESHTITYWSVDNAGVPEPPNTKVFTIHTNQPPVIGAIPNSIINEGGTYTTTGSFTDPDSTSWTGTVNYGDGSGVQTLTISGTAFALNHIYKDNGIYTVTVSITDNQGATGTATATVTVNNVAPTVGAIAVNPIGPQIINTLVNASANFTDPGVLDTHTAVWSWGDGSSASGVVAETNGSGSVTGSHAYTSAGVYTVVLTVADKDGGVGTSQYQYIVIYDPSSGFVTGGGVSNDGSMFGISAKYTSTNSTPTGNTGYTFNGGNSVFASTSYNWLVITGATAFLSGQGTINGTGQYNFLVSATDGVPDMLRIKITDLSGNVIYDNQPGAADTANPIQAITHGQIKIH